MRALYQSEGQPWEDYDEMTTYFKSVGIAGLAELNRLTEEENRELFVCRDVTRMVELILEGLARGAQATSLNVGTPAELGRQRIAEEDGRGLE